MSARLDSVSEGGGDPLEDALKDVETYALEYSRLAAVEACLRAKVGTDRHSHESALHKAMASRQAALRELNLGIRMLIEEQTVKLRLREWGAAFWGNAPPC